MPQDIHIITPDEYNAGPRGTRPRGDHPRYAAYGSVPGLVPFESSGIVRVPRAEWYDRIEEAWAKEQWPMCHIRPPMTERDQKQTLLCWGNAPCLALDIVRSMAGLPFNEASAASATSKINGFRNEGGWGIEAVKFMAETGPCSTDLWPNTAIDRRYDTPKSQADRANHKIVEWIDVPPNDLEALVSCVLPPEPLPCPVGLNWWQHEVTVVALKNLSRTSIAVVIDNSWGKWGYANAYGIMGFGDLTEAKGTPDDVQAVRIPTLALGV